MSTSKLANHMAAPHAAGIVGDFRQAFGDVKVVHIKEGDLELGRPTNVVDSELVRYSRNKKVKNKWVDLPTLEHMIGRVA